MPVETFSYLDSLNASNPVSTDGQAQGDDHIRGIKSVLKATFPSIAGACAITHTQLSNLGTGNMEFADGAFSTPSIKFSSDTGLGFYKVTGTGQTTVGIANNCRIIGDGTCPTGMIGDFLIGSPPAGWYVANGQAVPRTGATAALFAAIGTAYGAGNGTTTFNLPNLSDRFRRTAWSWVAGTFLGDAIKSHTATVSGSAADHTHAVSAGCSFSLSTSTGVMLHNEGGGGGAAGDVLLNSGSGSNALPVTGSISFSTSTAGSGSLGVSGTASYTGDSETRPLTFVCSTFIKA